MGTRGHILHFEMCALLEQNECDQCNGNNYHNGLLNLGECLDEKIILHIFSSD